MYSILVLVLFVLLILWLANGAASITGPQRNVISVVVIVILVVYLLSAFGGFHGFHQSFC